MMNQKAFKVEIQSFQQLSAEERACASTNGIGKECANYLRVTYGGDLILLESDAMEPEDCRFSRDLKWIRAALESAFLMGAQSNAQIEKAGAR